MNFSQLASRYLCGRVTNQLTKQLNNKLTNGTLGNIYGYNYNWMHLSFCSWDRKPLTSKLRLRNHESINVQQALSKVFEVEVSEVRNQAAHFWNTGTPSSGLGWYIPGKKKQSSKDTSYACTIFNSRAQQWDVQYPNI